MVLVLEAQPVLRSKPSERIARLLSHGSLLPLRALLGPRGKGERIATIENGQVRHAFGTKRELTDREMIGLEKRAPQGYLPKPAQSPKAPPPSSAAATSPNWAATEKARAAQAEASKQKTAAAYDAAHRAHVQAAALHAKAGENEAAKHHAERAQFNARKAQEVASKAYEAKLQEKREAKAEAQRNDTGVRVLGQRLDLWAKKRSGE